MLSSSAKIFENRLRYDRVTGSLKVGTFLRHSVVVVGLRFYRDSIFFYLLSFFHQLLSESELAGRNLTKTGHMLGNECDLTRYVQNLGCTLPLQLGGPKAIFVDDFAT